MHIRKKFVLLSTLCAISYRRNTSVRRPAGHRLAASRWTLHSTRRTVLMWSRTKVREGDRCTVLTQHVIRLQDVRRR